MDAIDQRILEILKEDSRISFNEVSKMVGKTEATVRRRVKRLIDTNVISKFTIQYELSTKPKTNATVKIEPDFKEIKRILQELRVIDEITHIWRLSGDCGLLVKIEIPSIEDFNPLIEDKISVIKGTKIVETCFITDVIK